MGMSGIAVCSMRCIPHQLYCVYMVDLPNRRLRSACIYSVQQGSACTAVLTCAAAASRYCSWVDAQEIMAQYAKTNVTGLRLAGLRLMCAPTSCPVCADMNQTSLLVVTLPATAGSSYCGRICIGFARSAQHDIHCSSYSSACV